MKPSWVSVKERLPKVSGWRWVEFWTKELVPVIWKFQVGDIPPTEATHWRFIDAPASRTIMSLSDIAKRMIDFGKQKDPLTERLFPPQNTAINEILLARARDLLYQAQGSLGWIGAINTDVLRLQIKTFLEDTKEPPQVLGECEECGHIIVSPLRRFERKP